MKRMFCTLLFSILAATFIGTMQGCGNGGPSGTIQPPKVDNTPVKGKVVAEGPSTDEK